MTYNIIGTNFHKTSSKSKMILATGANHVNEFRSSSTFDQNRNNLHSSPISKYKNLLSNADEKSMKKVYDYIPKINKVLRPIAIDPDKLQDQLIKLKVELNLKVKELALLKVEHIRSEEENKKNNKVIEEFINEATKYSPDINNYLRSNEEGYNTNYSNDINVPENEVNVESKEVFERNDQLKYQNSSSHHNMINFTNINPTSIIKLREVFMINSLKKQISYFKQILKVKEEEINQLKSSSKVAKFQILEIDYKQKMEDYKQIKEHFDVMKNTLTFKDNKLNELFEESEYYKLISNKVKSQLDETKEKMKLYQEDNLKIMEQKKSLEEKQNYNKLASSSFKSQIQSKENEIKLLKDEIKTYEAFKQEKPNLEKRIMDLTKLTSVLKDDQERKSQRIKDLEKTVMNNKASFEQEIENFTNKMNRKLKALEQENSNLKKSEAKYKINVKSSAFLTETKLEKKEIIDSKEDFRVKIRSLEDEIEAEFEKNNNLIYQIKQSDNENAIMRNDIVKLEIEKKKRRKELLYFEEIAVQFSEKIEVYNKEKIYFEEIFIKYQQMLSKDNCHVIDLDNTKKKIKDENFIYNQEKKRHLVEDSDFKIKKEEEFSKKENFKEKRFAPEITQNDINGESKEEYSCKKETMKEKPIENKTIPDNNKHENILEDITIKDSMTEKQIDKESNDIKEKKTKRLKQEKKEIGNESKNYVRLEQIPIDEENNENKGIKKFKDEININKDKDQKKKEKIEITSQEMQPKKKAKFLKEENEDDQNYQFDDYKDEDSFIVNKIIESFKKTGELNKNLKPSKDDNE